GNLHQHHELVARRGAGGDRLHAERLHGGDERAGVAKRLQPRQEGRREDLAPPLRDPLAKGGFLVDAGHRRHQLVAAHPDGAADVLELDLDPRLGKRLHPGVGVGVITVNEGTVDIEQDRGEHDGEVRLKPVRLQADGTGSSSTSCPPSIATLSGWMWSARLFFASYINLSARSSSSCAI